MLPEDGRDTLTPLMRQYVDIKAQFCDALVLFQVGDFYELFFDDAHVAASFLGITLTKRGTYNGAPIPLAGVPLANVDHYLSKLVKGGFKVALCDQLEEPKPGSLVRRSVTQVLTPGTLTEEKFLNDRSASYVLSFFPSHESWGLLFGELLAARLFGTVLPANADKNLDAELERFVPDEILIPSHAAGFRPFFQQRSFFTSIVDTRDEAAHNDEVSGWLERQFRTNVHEDLAQRQALRAALTSFYLYMSKNQREALAHFNNLAFYEPNDFLVLDAATMRNLEIVKNAYDGGRDNTLVGTVDKAVTSMGSRTIKKWITCPLVERRAIEQRHDALQIIATNVACMAKVRELFAGIGDLERLVGRIALGRADVCGYRALARSLAALANVREVLGGITGSELIVTLRERIYDFGDLYHLLKNALDDDEMRGFIIRPGFDADIDTLRERACNSQRYLLELEEHEQRITGISSLKIRYSQAYGYSIEITKANLDRVPSNYVRQQTLAGKERFTTPSLQSLERDIRVAQQASDEREVEIFESVKEHVARSIHALRVTSYALSSLDALFGLAHAAYEYGYARPEIHDGRDIIITEGRHPVVERVLAHRFIPNNVHLADDESLWIITGPNMGGKSTFLRHVALTCILAQAGSFVPASSARLAILDRIFTRIGAGDSLAEGKSTFLMEMEETAHICTAATARSLVVLDEVGRGTSTFDGLALAQAIIEYLFCNVGARCLFATHYHELTTLKERFAGIENYHAACTKTVHGIVFLYTIAKGIADGSFGIEVAKIAGLPSPVIARAREILGTLTSDATALIAGTSTASTSPHSHSNATRESASPRTELTPHEKQQLVLYAAIAKKLNDIDADELSPRKALELIWALKREAETL